MKSHFSKQFIAVAAVVLLLVLAAGAYAVYKVFLQSGLNKPSSQNDSLAAGRIQSGPATPGSMRSCKDQPDARGRDMCYFMTATMTKDATICKQISDARLRGDCADRAQESLATSNGDPSLCDGLTDEGRKSSCYANVAVSTKNLALCQKAAAGADDCISRVADAKNDLNLCEQVKDATVKGNCYSNFARKRQDPTLCEKAAGQKDNCYLMASFMSKDAAVCDKISAQNLKDSCFMNVAARTKNLELCSRIADNSMRGSCANIGKASAPQPRNRNVNLPPRNPATALEPNPSETVPATPETATTVTSIPEATTASTAAEIQAPTTTISAADNLPPTTTVTQAAEPTTTTAAPESTSTTAT